MPQCQEPQCQELQCQELQGQELQCQEPQCQDKWPIEDPNHKVVQEGLGLMVASFETRISSKSRYKKMIKHHDIIQDLEKWSLEWKSA